MTKPQHKQNKKGFSLLTWEVGTEVTDTHEDAPIRVTPI